MWFMGWAWVAFLNYHTNFDLRALVGLFECAFIALSIQHRSNTLRRCRHTGEVIDDRDLIVTIVTIVTP